MNIYVAKFSFFLQIGLYARERQERPNLTRTEFAQVYLLPELCKIVREGREG